jgi:flagellar FliL protein
VSTRTKAKEKEKDAPAEGEEGKGGKKKLLAIVAVLLVAVGAAAYFFLFSGGDAEAAEPVPGEVVTLEPIAVNLAGGGSLKIGIALQEYTEDGVEMVMGIYFTEYVTQ